MPDTRAADGTLPVYRTTEHIYQVDRDLTTKEKRHKAHIENLPDHKYVGVKVAMRALTGEDFHFVLNAWMQSYRVSARGIKNEDYYRGQQNLIAELGKRRQLIIACDADMPEFIFGFICGQPFENGRVLIDYLYVKKAYRERGLARGLLAALGLKLSIGATVTHLTPCVIDAVKAHNLDYNPYYNMLGYSDV